LINDIVGATNWYDEPAMPLDDIAGKFFIEKLHPAGFDNVASGTGTSSTAFDAAIKTITAHNAGNGSSTVEGVIINSTRAYRIEVRDASTNNAIDDGNGNEVYGRLTYTGGNYVIEWYSLIAGTETAYNFVGSVNLDLSYVAVSRTYENLDWGVFLESGFQDTSGIVGTILDDSVSVNGMTFLLSGLTTQAQINDKIDKLGSVAVGEGAAGVAINDAGGWFAAAQVEAALAEISSIIGSDTGSTHNFSEENVLADNDAVYAALEKLDQRMGDYESTALNEGASLIGVHDAAGNFTATNVEGVLSELWTAIDENVGWTKVTEEISGGPLNSGTNHTVPGGETYTTAAGGLNMDVYVNGQLMYEGTGNDYIEVDSTTVQFLFTIRPNSVITYQIRK
jgi:hypothetical protein